MSNQLISESVDIYQLPKADNDALGGKNTNLTIGDLHGNAMKLLFMLLKHGIARNISEEDYQALVAIYQKQTDEITQEDLSQFNELIAKIEIQADASIILIGDVLCDRGSNDYFTLKLLEKLHESGAHVETLLSNHDIEFIESYETNEDRFQAKNIDHSGQADSTNALQALIDKKLISRDSVMLMVKSAYKPTLKALAYTLNDDQNEITIYSHAGIGLTNIQAIAKKLGVTYWDSSVKSLAATIENINTKFQEYVQNHTVHTLYDQDNITGEFQEPESAPFEHLMWNRSYSTLDRPAQKNNYQIQFAHGHDSTELTHEHIFNLDNVLGKKNPFNGDTNNCGNYTVLYTTGQKLRLAQLDQDFLHSKASHAFLTHLQALFDKAAAFQQKGNSKAADAATGIAVALGMAFDNYTKNPNDKNNKQAFKIICDAQFKSDDRRELEKHRGTKKILINLALAIVGLGIGFIPLGLINLAATHGKHFFFHPKTDSAAKLDALEQSAEECCKPDKS
ncbi:Dot/Icm T4SS effector Wip [Legionella londiniensis]|uniref:Putative Dot/Icm substrate WipB n=1 Tax=Legionella londiniensis TaxID=45068 RepID=A0A0W0VKN1_9GAMM|nr:Dot/Icm T4SS effector Wip [Legionella londiniensis]KTD20668.1 putative Dot/Icm substrate WipB [Legionella londiniensis]STX92860.1 Dot/Icm secretion system substrate [Legionella londiniensis]